LTADETRMVEVHAATCPDCRAELRALSPVLVELARSVPQVAPPLALRARVLQATAPARDHTIVAARPARRDYTGWLAAAALAVLSLWLGADSLRLRREVTALQSELADARSRAEATTAQLTRLEAAAARNDRAMTVLTAPDLARIDLSGQAAAPDARARAFWSRSRGLVFSASRLPRLANGRTYQLWVVTAAAPVSVGLLEPDQGGHADAVFITPPDLATPVAMAVTEEPAGGVPAPTGQKYLVGVPKAGVS
jgi:anti-sigma-K factor RskA